MVRLAGRAQACGCHRRKVPVALEPDFPAASARAVPGHERPAPLPRTASPPRRHPAWSGPARQAPPGAGPSLGSRGTDAPGAAGRWMDAELRLLRRFRYSLRVNAAFSLKAVASGWLAAVLLPPGHGQPCPGSGNARGPPPQRPSRWQPAGPNPGHPLPLRSRAVPRGGPARPPAGRGGHARGPLQPPRQPPPDGGRGASGPARRRMCRTTAVIGRARGGGAWGGGGDRGGERMPIGARLVGGRSRRRRLLLPPVRLCVRSREPGWSGAGPPVIRSASKSSAMVMLRRSQQWTHMRSCEEAKLADCPGD
ncbi:translation initiation factor IF-2-like [Chelonia mydas]|uniref:translation initiation factor IF-2-like n=1 Tax=Chelonia mydas TaxID=8469 RepID=UPI001CAA1911|nr:translation initiation factor IF-2-like [Chelonia mydas]